MEIFNGNLRDVPPTFCGIVKQPNKNQYYCENGKQLGWWETVKCNPSITLPPIAEQWLYGTMETHDGTEKRSYRGGYLHSYNDEPSRVVKEGNKNPQSQEWHSNGKLHRLNGPAWLAGAPQTPHYFIYGIEFKKEDYDKHPDVVQYPNIQYRQKKLAELEKTGPRIRCIERIWSSEDNSYYIAINGTNTVVWHKDGHIHRDNGPAVEYQNGATEWWYQGQRHRTDGPAMIYSDGSTHWYQNDQLHRDNNPAVEWSNGDQEWYKDGLKHRDDGPARIFSNGQQEWWFKGSFCADEKTWINKKQMENIKTINDQDDLNILIQNKFTGCAKLLQEKSTWLYNGEKHRTDGPAVMYKDGTQIWMQHDQFHRIDGPAFEYSNGQKEWYFEGRLHRMNGPAIEFPNGAKEYWQYGKLHKTDGPACVYPNNMHPGEIQKAASTHPTAQEEWYYKGYRHREDGPALITSDGKESYYIFGEPVYVKMEYEKMLSYIKENNIINQPAIEVDDWIEIPPAFTGWARNRTTKTNLHYTNGQKSNWSNFKPSPLTSQKESLTSNISEPMQERNEPNMTTNNSVPTEPTKLQKVGKVLSREAQEAAKRTAVNQGIEIIRDQIVSFMTKGKNKKQAEKASNTLMELFKSDAGKVLLLCAIGGMIPVGKEYAPDRFHKILDAIASECRIQGMETVGNELLAFIRGPGMMVMQGLFSNISESFETSETEQVRVDTTNSTHSDTGEQVQTAGTTQSRASVA